MEPGLFPEAFCTDPTGQLSGPGRDVAGAGANALQVNCGGGNRAIRSELFSRNIAILVLAQAASVTGVVAIVTVGGIIGRGLAPGPALATLPVSLLILATAACTILASWIMSRIGRPRGFALGAALGMAGAVGILAAAAAKSFVLLCLAAMLIGCATAFSQQYRFAATESVRAQAAPLAISVVLTGSMAGAFLGPELVALGESWIPGAQFGGTFAAIAGCYLFAGALLLLLRPVSPAAPGRSAREARPLRVIARSRLFVLAVAGAALGQGVMAFVMTAVPLAMHVVDQHSIDATKAVIQAHVLAMYAPSLIAGGLIGRFGVGRVMLAGTALLGATLVAGLAGRHVMHYGIAMVALGVGWNFLYVGGTTLLARSYRSEERFRAQGFNDFSVFGCAALGSLSAGAVMQLLGWNAVLYASLPAILLAMAAILWVRPDRSVVAAR